MMVYLLILINLIVFYLVRTGKLEGDDLAVSYHQVFNRKEYQRILTSAFTHVDPLHLVCNMLSLYNVGPAVQSIYGKSGFLLLYFGSLLLGRLMALQIRHNRHDDYSLSLGASGAICGLIGAYLLFVARYYGMDGLLSMSRSLISLAIMSVLPGVDGTSHVCCLSMGMAIAFVLLLF